MNKTIKEIINIRNEVLYPNTKTYMAQVVDDNGDGEILEDTGLITRDEALAIKDKYINDKNKDIVIWCNCKSETDYHTALYDRQKGFRTINLFQEDVSLRELLQLLNKNPTVDIKLARINENSVVIEVKQVDYCLLNLSKPLKEQREEVLKKILEIIR